MDSGLVGGIGGAVIGVAGGVVGTSYSYRRAQSTRERRFVMGASLALTAYIGSFLAVLFLFPPTRPAIFGPYAIGLGLGIQFLNRQQGRIREGERKR